jgi:PAS domain S-box-containing protein
MSQDGLKIRLSLGAWLAIFAVTAVLPVVLFASITLQRLSKAERQETLTHLERDTEGAANRVERYLLSLQQIATTVAASPVMLSGDLANAYDFAKRVSIDASISDIALIDPHGKLLFTTSRPLGSVLPPSHIQAVIDQAFAVKGPRTSDLFKDPVTGAYTVGVLTPVVAQGEVRFLLAVAVDASIVMAVLSEESLPKNWVGAVLDREDVIVARTNSPAKWVGQKTSSATSAVFSSRPRGDHLIDNLDGVWVSGFHIKLPASGWTVAIGVPQTDLEAPFRASLFLMLAFGLVSLGVASFFALLIGRHMQSQIANIARIAAAVGEGKEPVIRPSSVLELNDVSRSLVAAYGIIAAKLTELRALFDANPIGIIRSDLSGRVLDANDAVLRIFGATRDDLITGRLRWDELTAPESHGVTEQAVAEALADPAGRSSPYEKAFVRRDGTRVVLLNSFVLLDREHMQAAVFMMDLTDLRRLDARLAESEARLRLFVDRAPAAIAMFDTGMRYLAVSQRFMTDYALTGETAQSLLGRSHYEIFSDISDKWRAVHRRVLAGETVSAEEDPFPRADGATDWLRWEMTPWFQAEGSIGGAILFSEVITARKLAEAALAASEARFRSFTENSNDVIYIVNAATKKLEYISPAYERVWGESREVIMRDMSRWTDSLHPDDVADALAKQHQLQRGEPVAGEYRIIRAGDGAVRHIQDTAVPIRDADAQIILLAGIARDITEYKAAEAALSASEERLRMSQEAGRVGSWDWNLVTRKLHWSDLQCRQFGVDPATGASVDYKVWRDAIHPDDLASCEDTLRRIFKQGTHFEMEYRINIAGEVRWMNGRGHIVRDLDGKAVRMIGIDMDITQRRALEDELRSLTESLDVRVREEILARQEAQARAAHGERLQALGQLAGGIAHDFNNILQAVMGALRLIERRTTDQSGIRRLTQLASGAVERGASITRRLLALGRRGELRAEPVDVFALLEGLHEILTHTLGASIKVRLRLEHGLSPMLADRGQLETVLVNLATNARDAMQDGGELILSADQETVVSGERPHPLGLLPGRYVRLTVSDTGVGMDTATLARAREPFFTTKKTGAGTGLGLALAHGFAEQSGGGMSIKSQPGGGTTVELWLPEAASEASTGGILPPRVARPPEQENAARTRILLVDDEAAIREVLAAHLEDAGYDVLLAATGEEALVLIATENVDALITDLSMPGMNGLSVIQGVQARYPGLPAVLLTGYAGDETALALSGAISGTFSLLRKPVSEDHLLDRLHALLAARSEVGR